MWGERERETERQTVLVSLDLLFCCGCCFFIYLFILFFCLFLFLWAAPAAYGGSQARDRIGAVAAGSTPEPQQRGIQAASATYTAAHGNAGWLTHGARAGTELTTTWFLVRFVNHCARTGTPVVAFLGPRLQHIKVPSLGVQSELQLPAYTTATATPDPSLI